MNLNTVSILFLRFLFLFLLVFSIYLIFNVWVNLQWNLAFKIRWVFQNTLIHFIRMLNLNFFIKIIWLTCCSSHRRLALPPANFFSLWLYWTIVSSILWLARAVFNYFRILSIFSENFKLKLILKELINFLPSSSNSYHDLIISNLKL